LKKIGSTTALLAGIAFTSTAYAETAPSASISLLDGLLANAEELSASLSNISQNLNDIDGSINVTTSRSLAELALGIGAIATHGDFGSFIQAGVNVIGRDIPASLLAVLDPLTLTLGDLATTAIGTLQSGNMNSRLDSGKLVVTIDATYLVSDSGFSASGTMTGVMSKAEQFGSIANTLAMQNMSVNTGSIDGSVTLALANVNTSAGDIATTAIGALQSGTLTATVNGLGAVEDHTSDIVRALVGTSTVTEPVTATPISDSLF